MAEPIDDEQGDDEQGDDGVTSAPPGRLARLLSPTAAPTAATRTPLPTNARGSTTKWAIDRLDGRERLYGYGCGVAAVFFAVLIWAVESHDEHLKLSKGQFSPVTTLIVGLACAVLLFVTTRIGRRALVGFVALFTFLGFSQTDFVIGLPFLILAAWLLYRSYKVQKEATARIKSERSGTGGSSEGSGRGPRSAATSGRAAADARTAARKKGPAVPEGNKRFTPKKPTPPAPPPPKPSWRERRAARTD